MEKLHIRKIASLGLMLCFFTGVGAQIKVIRANNRNSKLNTKNLLKHLEHSSRFSL